MLVYSFAFRRATLALAVCLSGTALADGPGITPPRLIRESCSPPAYPHESRADFESGTVKLAIGVGPDGAMKSVDVSQSSGYDTLDRAAREGMAGCRFTPQLRGGIAEAGVATLQYVWQLSDPELDAYRWKRGQRALPPSCVLADYPKPAQSMGETGIAVAAFSVDHAGHPADVVLRSPTGSAWLDRATLASVKSCVFDKQTLLPGERGMVRFVWTLPAAGSEWLYSSDASFPAPEATSIRRALAAAANIEPLLAEVDLVIAQCAAQWPDQSPAQHRALRAWHLRNDAVVNQAAELKAAAQGFASTRPNARPASLEPFNSALREHSRAHAEEVTSWTRQPEGGDDASRRCAAFAAAVADGQRDVRTLYEADYFAVISTTWP